MLDLSHIPSQQQQTFTFYSLGAGVWQTWNKPRNAKMIEIFCLGGGAGGAQPNAAAGTGNGGAGGGSAGIVRGLIPAFLLPDTLYILVGKGGSGATTNNTVGTPGGISYVGLQPSTTEQTLICKSSTAAAGAVTTTSAATISVVALSAFGNLGLLTPVAGVVGSTGGSGAVQGNSQTALASNITTGGAGGGGKTSVDVASGGNIAASSVILTSQVNGATISGGTGDSGYGTLQPFCGTGGAGGASVLTGTGGKGGNGFYGCGGGGGGGSSVTCGNGGNGGDGLVIITVIS